VMVYSCVQPAEVVMSVNETAGEISQLSVEVAAPVFSGNVIAEH
jgi:hypothetical protein